MSAADAYWRQLAERLVDKSDRELNEELQPIDNDDRNIVRGIIAELRAARPQPGSQRTTPRATRVAAEEAYRRLNSERKAADELGISKTQLRRLLGLEP